MKMVLSAVAATAAFTAVALAQTTPPAPPATPAVTAPADAILSSSCAELPPEPTQPDITGMRAKQVTELHEKTMNAWLVQANQIVECRNREINANNQVMRRLAAERDIVGGANKSLAEANSAFKGRADAFRNGWQAKLDAYEAQQKGSNRSGRSTR